MSFPSVVCLPMCPCRIDSATGSWSLPSPICRSRKRYRSIVVNPCSSHRIRRVRSRCGCSKACTIPSDGSGNRNPSVNVGFANSARLGTNRFLLKRFSQDSADGRELAEDSPVQLGSQFANFEEDPIVGKLRTHLGVIHPIPSPPINRNIAGLFVFFFFVGVVFDKIWTSRKKTSLKGGGQPGVWPQVPTSFSAFLEKDLQRKESVEWVNMVLGKLWKVYRVGIENWIIGLLQPVIDDLKKPDYVQRVEIKQFSLGDEPLSVRNVERRTSRSVDDLQYQIGIRYTGGARMLLMLSLNFGVVPIVIPVGVRDFDIDGGALGKTSFNTVRTLGWSCFMGLCFTSKDQDCIITIPPVQFDGFLTKLLTEDLPRLFVRPKKIVLDFQKGKAVGPVVNDFLSKERQEGNKDYAGELSVTLVDARKLSYVFYGKTDPYVILCMGDQEIRSKKNSQTTVIGPPGEPIWNQDFHMLVGNPRKDKLYVTVKDSLGFGDLTVGIGEVDLGSLEDTVPTDTIVALQGGWGLPGKKSSGEILLRLTYKAYVEDEEDDWTMMESIEIDGSDDELSDSDEYNVHRDRKSKNETEKESFMDVLAALIVSEEFQGIVATETGNTRFSDPSTNKGSLLSKSPAANARPLPSDPDSNSEGSQGSSLVWFAVITSIAVVIAINMSNSGVFNP